MWWCYCWICIYVVNDRPPPPYQLIWYRIILRTNHPGSCPPQQEPTEEVVVVDMIQQPPRHANKLTIYSFFSCRLGIAPQGPPVGIIQLLIILIIILADDDNLTWYEYCTIKLLISTHSHKLNKISRAVSCCFTLQCYQQSIRLEESFLMVPIS